MSDVLNMGRSCIAFCKIVCYCCLVHTLQYSSGLGNLSALQTVEVSVKQGVICMFL